MLDFLLAGENVAFVVALVIMVLIGIVEVAGLGASALGHDLDLDGDMPVLGWLGIGRIPLLMLLVIFLSCFGVIGLIGQQLALDHFGALLGAGIAIPSAAAAALPLTGVFARGIASIIPRDETTAIDVERLVGLQAEIVIGRATPGNPAKARVRDYYGQVHYVMAEPDMPDQAFAEGDEILLVRRESGIFRAITSDRRGFTNWIDR